MSPLVFSFWLRAWYQYTLQQLGSYYAVKQNLIKLCLKCVVFMKLWKSLNVRGSTPDFRRPPKAGESDPRFPSFTSPNCYNFLNVRFITIRQLSKITKVKQQLCSAQELIFCTEGKFVFVSWAKREIEWKRLRTQISHSAYSTTCNFDRFILKKALIKDERNTKVFYNKPFESFFLWNLCKTNRNSMR